MADNIVIQNDEIISVGELNKSAKYLLENNFSNVSVIGEISNLAKPSSGHIYFTLRMQMVQLDVQCLRIKILN